MIDPINEYIEDIGFLARALEKARNDTVTFQRLVAHLKMASDALFELAKKLPPQA